jgi:outer membrane receptor protein involved in Fe transport
VRRLFRSSGLLCLGLAASIAITHAEPIALEVPAQPADVALLALAGQAQIEVLFSSSDLHPKTSTAVVGRFEPADALNRLLRRTGFVARPTGPGKFAIVRAGKPTSTVSGRLLGPDGAGARRVRVALPAAHLTRVTDENGDYRFSAVPVGTYEMVVSAAGLQTLQLGGLRVVEGTPLVLPTQTLQSGAEPAQLAPFVVEGTLDPRDSTNGHPVVFPPRTAVGNLDLARSENDAIPFTILDREQIRRSGVVNLNEFLQRELIDSNSTIRPPEQDATLGSFVVGSSNLGLRGFTAADETIILVNGRRLPEVLTSGSSGAPRMPDVNFIPLSLVQQVEVLPISASSLYNGNPVGGVINIVLRPGVDSNSTEVTATYNNAFRGFDAPQSSLSLLNSESLLGGALRLRFNVSTTRSEPATEAELALHRRNLLVPSSLDASIHRATPNLRSADLSPLFGPDSSPVTSVAPGANGSGGLAAFAGRQGRRNLDLFDGPGGLAASTDSLDFPYGREQQRDAYFGSIVYDLTPWLQVGLDATFATTTVHRGYDVLGADLTLAANSPLNPFQQDVVVSLNETARSLGQNYSEARFDYSSLVLGALVHLPAAWRLSLDAQYAHNVTKYRGLLGADTARWQALVDSGRYNPLRDTQVFDAPAEFYDQVLIFRGTRGQFVTLGDYDALDAAFRLTNEALRVPTGLATVNLGGDYRRSHLAGYREEYRYADGSLARPPSLWADRVLQRYSVFGEIRAPVLPARLLPAFLRAFNSDLALRYVGANSAKESYLAPTLGLKVDLANGFSFRGSFTTSSRYPTPQLNKPVSAPPTSGGVVTPYTEQITDPLRGGQQYSVGVTEVPNPGLLPESALTQAFGVLFQRGKIHRLRATLDFVDTHKTNEEIFVGSGTAVSLEKYFPERVLRAPLAAGDPNTAGVITSVLTGRTNLAWRHSQNWNGSVDYAWTKCHGGTLELYGRLLYFELYQRQILPGAEPVDEIALPASAESGLLRYRANFGAGWSNRDFGFGVDGRYYSPRVLPVDQWAVQGHDRIRPAWQFDAYVESDLGRWLPWDQSRHGLRAQLRVNNVFGERFPKYLSEPSGAGVQPYGDWRGRTYSLSMTASF